MSVFFEAVHATYFLPTAAKWFTRWRSSAEIVSSRRARANAVVILRSGVCIIRLRFQRTLNEITQGLSDLAPVEIDKRRRTILNLINDAQ